MGHILKNWGLGCWHMDFCGTQFNALHVTTWITNLGGEMKLGKSWQLKKIKLLTQASEASCFFEPWENTQPDWMAFPLALADPGHTRVWVQILVMGQGEQRLWGGGLWGVRWAALDHCGHWKLWAKSRRMEGGDRWLQREVLHPCHVPWGLVTITKSNYVKILAIQGYNKKDWCCIRYGSDGWKFQIRGSLGKEQCGC